MLLLDYLTPSRARRAALEALRSGEAFTVRRLSRAAGIPYSAAHREIGRLAETGLVRRKRTGRAWSCAWNPRHPLARALGLLLRESAPANEAAIVANLRRWGAPLAEPARSSRRLDLEETLAEAARLARRRPDVARVWPILFARHHPGVDLSRLAALGRRLGERRALGFLLALSARLLRDGRLARTAESLRDGRFRAVEDFFSGAATTRLRDLATRRSPALARRWGFRMNSSLEGFESQFRKFEAAR